MFRKCFRGGSGERGRDGRKTPYQPSLSVNELVGRSSYWIARTGSFCRLLQSKSFLEFHGLLSNVKKHLTWSIIPIFEKFSQTSSSHDGNIRITHRRYVPWASFTINERWGVARTLFLDLAIGFCAANGRGIYFCCVRIKGYSSFTTFAENNARNNIMTTSSALLQMDWSLSEITIEPIISCS